MDPLRMIDGDSYYYFWYDTYPMEFAVFLLDSALARGIYFHTMFIYLFLFTSFVINDW
jgi:hypothetical protein